MDSSKELLKLTVRKGDSEQIPRMVSFRAHCDPSLVETWAHYRLLLTVDIRNNTEKITRGLTWRGLDHKSYNEKVGIRHPSYTLQSLLIDHPVRAIFCASNLYSLLLGVERIPMFYDGPDKGIYDYTLEEIVVGMRVYKGNNKRNMLRARAFDYFLYDELPSQDFIGELDFNSLDLQELYERGPWKG